MVLEVLSVGWLLLSVRVDDIRPRARASEVHKASRGHKASARWWYKTISRRYKISVMRSIKPMPGGGTKPKPKGGKKMAVDGGTKPVV